MVRDAEVAELDHVRGAMVIRPWGYGIWELMQRALDDAIKETGDNTFKGGSEVFDLAHDGLSYSKSNTALMTPDIIDQVEQYKQDIISGKIKVPEKP